MSQRYTKNEINLLVFFLPLNLKNFPFQLERSTLKPLAYIVQSSATELGKLHESTSKVEDAERKLNSQLVNKSSSRHRQSSRTSLSRPMKLNTLAIIVQIIYYRPYCWGTIIVDIDDFDGVNRNASETLNK